MVNSPPISRFSVWLVDLNPTRGSEQSGSRPVVVISPDEMNSHLNTVIVAPMTTVKRGWPTRVSIRHGRRSGEVALDQIRTLDKSRLRNQLRPIADRYHRNILGTLAEMFAE